MNPSISSAFLAYFPKLSSTNYLLAAPTIISGTPKKEVMLINPNDPFFTDKNMEPDFSIDPKLLNDLQFIFKDILSGDPNALKRPEYVGLNINQIKAALEFILANEDLSDFQKDDLLSNSWRLNYRDRPPSAEEFVTEKYLGSVAPTLYPWVKEAFLDFLDPMKPYRTLVLYPYIGFGKSFTAVLINLFVATHLSMMRTPWKFFGLSPATVFTQVYCATSQKKSSELLLEPMLNILGSSEFFEKVQRKDEMVARERDFERMDHIDRIFWTTAVPTSALQFSNGANFKLISSPNGLLGQTIVTGTMTELSFFFEAGRSDEWIFKFFSKLRGRIESRMKGNYFGRFVLDSSPNTLESVIDDWIVNDAPKNPSNYIVKGSRWKYAKGDFEEGTFDENGDPKPEKCFQVFVGGKGRMPEIIDPRSRTDYNDMDILNVPDTLLNSSMKGMFEENIFEALKDQAGIPAGSSDKIFYDYSKIERVFVPQLKNVYTHIVASSKDNPEGLIWNQIKDQFFIKYINSYQFWYKPHVPRVFAVDQSESGDVTAIAIAHLEREMRTPVPGQPPVASLMYIVDLVVPITPKGGRINLDAIRYFIEDLRDKGSMQLIYGSFDQYQSAATMQYLERRGFEVEKLSVDNPMDPYLNFISIIESDRLRSGRNLHLKNNLKSLQIVRRKDAEGKKTGSQKVDHTHGDIVLEGSTSWEHSFIGIHAKDISDAVCACCELLRKYDVMPYEEWKPEEIREKTREDAQEQITKLLEKHKWGVA